METEADGITADMEITELNRRDVPVVRFISAPGRPLWRYRPVVQLRFQDGEPARDGTLTGIRTRICTESSLYMGTVTAW